MYWYAIGDVFSAPRGTRELIIEGVDTAHVEVVSRTKVRQFSRKVFVFRDIETNEVVSQHQGKPLNRIAYDYQYITYSLENGSLVAETTMGTGDSVVTLRGDRFYWRNLKDSFAISSPLFTERGWIENYDFYGGNGMYHMAWCGSGPSTIVDTGHVMMEMSSVRMDSFNELPDSMKQYILEHAPKWQFPPKDLSEVTQIQKGESHTEGF